jgi:hypothetical protein
MFNSYLGLAAACPNYDFGHLNPRPATSREPRTSFWSFFCHFGFIRR